MLIWLQIIPIIPSVKPKLEYPDQIIMTHYLILIWYLFDNYWIIIRLIWYQTHLFLPGYAAPESRWPCLLVQWMWFLFCLIHHCKVSPVHVYFCDDTQTHGWIQTRRYTVCIWNSRIARSTCFSPGSFDGASATSASAVLAICVARQLVPTCNVYCEHREYQLKSQGYCWIRSKSMCKRQNRLF